MQEILFDFHASVSLMESSFSSIQIIFPLALTFALLSKPGAECFNDIEKKACSKFDAMLGHLGAANPTLGRT